MAAAMHRTFTLLPLLLTATLCAGQYSLGPDSQRQAGVPRGTVTKASFTGHGGVYPGISRDYWVYVPSQYDAAKPACLVVFQDGKGAVDESGNLRVPIVLDNLIAKYAMPVTIGVFIDPGVYRASGQTGAPNLLNRSYEYDTVDDSYARFLSEELLPQVTRQWNISTNPDDRAIAGASSGAIAAFTAAMLRPDLFHRVLSFIGSYTNLRGGNQWPDLVRKMEPAPLRIFMQDGNHDLNIFAGDWWMANQDMASALTARGYQVKFVTGTEDHNTKQEGAVLPEALTWLWQGWPDRVPMPSKILTNNFADLENVMKPGSSWEMVGEGYSFTEGPAVDAQGNVFFCDVLKNKIYKVDAHDGKVSLFKEDTGGASGLMFGADGRLYAAANGAKQIVAYESDGRKTVLADHVGSNDIAVSSKGAVYFTDPSTKSVWFIDHGTKKQVVSSGLQFPNGLRFSADESLMMVADSATRWIWVYQVQANGDLANGEPFYRLALPLVNNGKLVNAWADGIAFDTSGNLYAATKTGIQVCDQVGRVFGILRKPSAADPSNLVLGGSDFQTLYVTAKDKVFRRRLQTKGYLPWTPPKWPSAHL